MCGIAGIYNSIKRNNLKRLSQMLLQMRFRGPDGTEQREIGNSCCLGAVRLAMIDSQSRDIILSNEQNDIFLVFNGEIYNYQELRAHLLQKGHIFKTKGDGEVIIHLYEEYGMSFVRHLNGMFSFALISKNRLILSVDSFGIKPLFFYVGKDNEVIFSSSLISILSITGRHTISQKGLESYLSYRCIIHPYSIFKDIFKLGPGEIVVFNGKTIKKHKYSIYRNKISSDNLKEELFKSVRNAMNSDFPIGFFLSGGLDSSILTALAAKENFKNLEAFTVEYADHPEVNETCYASKMAEMYKIKHNVVSIKDKDIPTLLCKTIIALEEPLFSTVALSTYALAMFSKEKVKGIISGDGSDELFIGYQYIRTALESKNPIDTYLSQIGWLKDEFKTSLFNFKLKKLNLIKKSRYALRDMLRFEHTYRLPNYHLVRLDKSLMAQSVEGRVPFLTNNVVNYTKQQKLKNIFSKRPKQLLIDEFKDILPECIIDRKKRPFTAPYTNWIDGVLYSEIAQTFSIEKYVKFLHIKGEKLKDLLNKKNKDYFDYTAIWGLFILLKWMELNKKYINFKNVRINKVFN